MTERINKSNMISENECLVDSIYTVLGYYNHAISELVGELYGEIKSLDKLILFNN
jgi:hypothetical protein